MNIMHLFPQQLIEQARTLVCNARRVAIICHISPDGDAIGSSLAIMHLLQQSGRTAHVVTPDTPPSALTFLPGAEQIVSASTHTDEARGLLRNADLIICADFSQLSRIGRLEEVISAVQIPILVIDHHLQPTIDARVTLSAPEESSTCSLLFHVLRQMELTDAISDISAQCILAGMMTDTGNFSYNCADPQLYLIVAELIARGADKEKLYKRLFNTISLNRLQLNAYALNRNLRIYPQHRAAIITMSARELAEFHYVKGDTEGLVNVPLGIPDIVYSVFLREDRAETYVRVSVRSKGDFPADRFCSECFNGGGHLNAAGGEVLGNIAQAVELVENAFCLFDKYLPSNDAMSE